MYVLLAQDFAHLLTLMLPTKHARLCEEGAVRLKERQNVDKEKQTIDRVTLCVHSLLSFGFSQLSNRIYERLLALGFESADLEEPSIRRHKDVDNPRLLTKEGMCILGLLRDVRR